MSLIPTAFNHGLLHVTCKPESLSCTMFPKAILIGALTFPDTGEVSVIPSPVMT